MIRRVAAAAITGAAGFAGGQLYARSASDRSVRLATTVWNPVLPTTVLVHGLESSRETWRGTLEYCLANALPAVAVDLRGHGESNLGDPTEFSVDEMVEDVHAAAIATGPGKIVLVGHSMGGRVAISYAAKYPEHIAALVIEDMDLRPRSTDWEKTLAVESFDRTFPSMEAAVDALSTVGGYGADRVKYWLGTRLRPTPTGGVWSDVNPQSRDLARKHVLETRDGWEAYTRLGHIERTSSGGLPFPVHLLVAGKGSACDDPDEMARLLPATQIHTFPMSGHSIHREARDDFMKLLHRIVFTAGNSKL